MHPLRNDFGASSPLPGSILALYPLRNGFRAFSPSSLHLMVQPQVYYKVLKVVPSQTIFKERM
jgi:hypothetical protein